MNNKRKGTVIPYYSIRKILNKIELSFSYSDTKDLKTSTLCYLVIFGLILLFLLWFFGKVTYHLLNGITLDDFSNLQNNSISVESDDMKAFLSQHILLLNDKHSLLINLKDVYPDNNFKLTYLKYRNLQLQNFDGVRMKLSLKSVGGQFTFFVFDLDGDLCFHQSRVPLRSSYRVVLDLSLDSFVCVSIVDGNHKLNKQQVIGYGFTFSNMTSIHDNIERIKISRILLY